MSEYSELKHIVDCLSSNLKTLICAYDHVEDDYDLHEMHAMICKMRDLIITNEHAINKLIAIVEFNNDRGL